MQDIQRFTDSALSLGAEWYQDDKPRYFSARRPLQFIVAAMIALALFCAPLASPATADMHIGDAGLLGSLTQIGQRAYAMYLAAPRVAAQGTGPITPHNQTIDAGSFHTCIISAPVTLECWGFWAPLLQTNSVHVETPIQIPGIDFSGGRTLISVVTGAYHTCVLLSDGSVQCWGKNEQGELGLGVTTPTGLVQPTVVPGLTDIAILRANSSATCAISKAGVLKCWGKSTGVTILTSTPSTLPGGDGRVIDVAMDEYGPSTICAVFETGNVKCIGSNATGQLGNGNQVNSPSAMVDVVEITNAVDVAVSMHVGCALLADGNVKCWGTSFYGQRGDGINPATGAIGSPITPPTAVIGIDGNGAAIDATTNGFCTLLTDGNVKCWGFTGNGEFGMGHVADLFIATYMPGTNNMVSEIATGNYHSCVLLTDGAAKCTGQDASGQIGESHVNRSFFVLTGVDGLGSGSIALNTPLQIAKSDPTPNPPMAGQPVQYTIVVTNTSTVTRTNVTLTEMPSAGLDMTAFTSAPAGSCSTTSGKCTLTDPLAPGAFATFNVTFDVSAAAGAVISNTAYVTSTESLMPFYPTTTPPLVGVTGGSGLTTTNLKVTKSAAATSAMAGTQFDYTITVSNMSGSTATNVRAIDTLPNNVTFDNATAADGGNCTHSSGTVTCLWGSLAGGASTSATITVTPN